ncbi:MAG: hypothetical protein ACE5OZ_17410 [Candidatus Heimdallarchaeota archaeon]
MNNDKMVGTALIIGVIFIVFDMLVAIITNPIFSGHSDLPIWKDPPNIIAGILFDLINGFILVIVYKTIYDGIPGLNWRKGLNYGIIVGLFRVVMMAFSTFVMYDIPLELIITSLVAGYIEIVLLCIILATIADCPRRIVEESYEG